MPASPLLAALQSALTSRWPALSLTYWRERRRSPSDPEREPNLLFRSHQTKRARLAMADRRLSDLSVWAEPDGPYEASVTPVTICVVTHNSADVLERFEAGILALGYPSDLIRFQFVDNGSTDGTRDWLDGFSERHDQRFHAISIHHQNNLGFARGQNFAIDNAETDFLLVCNPDAQLAPGSLTTAFAQAHRDPNDIAAWEFAQRPFEHPKYYDPVTLETSWNSHACVLLRRAAFDAIGGYDPNLFLYGEDVDLSYRLRRAGYRLRYLPKAWVHHDVSTATGRRSEQAFRTLAANLLLRRRFGTGLDRWVGRQLIRIRSGDANNPIRHRASILFKDLKGSFRPEPRRGRHFPFNGVDYERRRLGIAYPMPVGTERFREGPLVSIITRSHTDCPLLTQAIATVRHQTYPQIEHIVVEDGYEGDKRHEGVRFIQTDGVGRSRAGNLGAAAAQGDWLMWLDYDDLLLADHVETLVDAVMNANPSERDIIGACAHTWECASVERNGVMRPISLTRSAVGPAFITTDDLSDANPLAIQSVLFSRRLFDQLGGFDERLDLLEDWDLWQRYSAAGDFIFVPKTTSLFHTPHAIRARIRRQLAFRHAEAGFAD